ncbi:hybrid sensor histidine kinase/response regulator (plasmid) [Tundrisphaera sp. TA3]|uniref:hybrid sensor histidine kinase/response regulator n=1 Tax=Tundrisphaera sp. TA3 TaxID=3435775 RepID=UPI003EBE0FD7
MSDDLSGFSLMDLFRSEADGQTAALAEGLLNLEGEGASPAAIEPLMRAAHSLKGAARIVGLDAAVRVAHALEDCFVDAQKGAFAIQTHHVDIFLNAVDLLSRCSMVAESEISSWQAEHEAEIAGAVAQLEAIREGKSAPAPAPNEPIAPAPGDPPNEPNGAGEPADLGTPNEPNPPPPTDPAAVVPNEPNDDPPPSVAPPNEPNESGPDDLLDDEHARAVTGRIESMAPELSIDDMPVQGPQADSPNRVVRVSAESLTRLMGLAGESLVHARQLRPLVDALTAHRAGQAALLETLRALEDRRSSGPGGGVEMELIAKARGQVDRSLQDLGGDVELFEDYARRGEDLAGRLHHEVLASRMRPMSEGARGFPRMVRDVSRQLGKMVRFELKGENTGVDRDILDKLEAPLNHLIRNSLDHAIESPAEREAAGKSPTGTIRLEARHRAGLLQITLSDDGRGIDVERLRVKVVEKRLVAEGMAGRLTEAELLEFLFLPGFSTRDSVTELSGRGVGLDVVQDMVRTVGGTVRIASRPGRGTKFTLHLPITMSVVRALLVRVAGEPYAFPLNRIDRIARVSRSGLRMLEGRPHFPVDDQLVGLVEASQVFGLPGGETSGDELPIVVASDRSQRFGVVVEAFLGERDLEVRPLDPRLGKPPDINSASVLEDGWPVLIVDVEDMVRSIDNLFGGRRLKGLSDAAELAARPSAKRILVVDDSITVRELERQLLEGRGYDVDVAVDGVDGWNAARGGGYHLIISDVDMPRMDGIQLVRSIKSDARLRGTPVIIVSYKDREEDRMRGLDAGADGYLTKSSFHDRTFLDAVVDLIGEAAG